MTDLRGGQANGPPAADDDSDDIEMEIEDEEDETVVYKDSSKAALDACNTMQQQKHNVSIQKMAEESETKKREINLKMEDDLESSIASGGEQR